MLTDCWQKSRKHPSYWIYRVGSQLYGLPIMYVYNCAKFYSFIIYILLKMYKNQLDFQCQCFVHKMSNYMKHLVVLPIIVFGTQFWDFCWFKWYRN